MLRDGKFDGCRGSKKKLALTTGAEKAFKTLRQIFPGELGLIFFDPD